MADRGSTIYAEFISTLLAGEEVRKASFEAKGIAVVTTSGVLVSLMLGFVTTVGGRALPASANAPLLVGGILFVIAGAEGISINVPFLYKSVSPASLKARTELWDDAAAEAELMVASTQANLYASARRTNSVKALLLLVALSTEVVALVPLLITLADVLQHRR